jgi:hypothetical protein
LLENALGKGALPRRFSLLTLSIALVLSLEGSAHGYEFGEPEVRAIGPAEVVFDYSTTACDSGDIPDTPARAFHDSTGRVQLIDSHALARRKIGPDLNSVRHQCGVILDSDGNQDPSMFDDKEWLSSVYTLDGQTIYGFMSTEYQGWNNDESCAQWAGTIDQNKCWYNSIGLSVSQNGGASYSHAPAPTHLVAASPYRYSPGIGPLGIFDPSNIIQKDGYYYMMVRVEPHEAQQLAACLLRTQTLGDPKSWRAWDGTGFGVRFINPYIEESEPPEAHVCAPVSPQTLRRPIQTASLTYSTYLGKYVLAGVSQEYDQAAARWNGGFYYTLSSDLINWSAPKILMKGQLPWTHRCTDPDPNPVRDPALLDPTSSSRNFETIGRHPYLYFTRFNFTYWDATHCWATLDRDLLRIPIEFTAPVPNQPPTASFTVSPNPVTGGGVASFDGSASSDPEGEIADFAWDLDGNGTFETDGGATATASRTYPTVGTITVKLRVRDSDGASDEVAQTLTIQAQPRVADPPGHSPSPSPAPPVAPPPGMLGPPQAVRPPSAAVCAAARKRRVRYTRMLRAARKRYALARTPRAKRRYRERIRMLRRHLRLLQIAGCAR